MAQLIKALATKFDNLDSVPGTDSCKLFSEVSIGTVVGTQANTCKSK